jgi:hypothetical protein
LLARAVFLAATASPDPPAALDKGNRVEADRMSNYPHSRAFTWRPAAGQAVADPAPPSGDSRPTSVPGPLGTPLTLADLPAPGTTRWVVRRKAEVLAAINGGLLSAADACARYGLSPEELDLWQQAIDRAGVPGLRVTRIQLYRELDRQRAPVGTSQALRA